MNLNTPMFSPRAMRHSATSRSAERETAQGTVRGGSTPPPASGVVFRHSKGRDHKNSQHNDRDHNDRHRNDHHHKDPNYKDRRWGARSVTAAALSGLLLVSGCTIDNDGSAEQSSGRTEEKTSKPTSEVKGKLSTNVKDGAQDWGVNKKIKVTSEKQIAAATITDVSGNTVEGKLNDDKTEWASTGDLQFGTTYTLTAKAGDKEISRTFTTQVAQALASTALAPLDGATVGVAQTISLIFDTPIPDRKAVEKAIEVKTDNNTEGAFYWLNDRMVRWRPKDYWEPGTKVSVKTHLRGVDLGNGTFATEERNADFTIGDDVRAIVDDKTKMMDIFKNGKKIKTMPTSNGRDGEFATPNGVYTVGEQHEHLMMDSTTYGLALDAGGYQTQVAYATQMSYSGIYIHGAPWSEWAQGSQNTSHGCINVSVPNAQWVFENLKRGDIVEVKNTSGDKLNGMDGLGDWMIPWEKWKAGNADQ
ncbi:L,D-transpeptidase [Corynebacterium auriscanis]|uniref:L,D-transpeptidase n=1 Tax=Corynebacterium auriscanis TaxID=99807 RepID=UPI003CED8EFE